MLPCCNCSNNTAIPLPSRKRWSSTRPHSRSRSFLDSISAPSDSSRRCSASFQPPSTRRYRQPRRRRSCSCRCSDRRRSCSRNWSPPIVPLSSLEPRPFGVLANLLQKLPNLIKSCRIPVLPSGQVQMNVVLSLSIASVQFIAIQRVWFFQTSFAGLFYGKLWKII